MTIEDILYKKGYTISRLSKEARISKTTLYSIFSGKRNLHDCRAETISKLAQSLDISLDEIASLEQIPYKPAFEENLPLFLDEDIKFLKNKKNKGHPFYDCYLDEANSSINVCEVENLITKEQADYLRKKFLKW